IVCHDSVPCKGSGRFRKRAEHCETSRRELGTPCMRDAVRAVPIPGDDYPLVLPVAGPEILTALPAEEQAPLDVLPVRAGLIARTWRLVCSVTEWLFGALTLLVGLSFLAAIPILQFLSLGYLVESSGRIARTGRLRDGFIGVRRAARIGGIVLGAWLM